MGVIGTSAGGYATVLPTQGNPIGEAMSNVENSAFRYSAQKMAKDKMKQDAERDLYDRRRGDDKGAIAENAILAAIGNSKDTTVAEGRALGAAICEAEKTTLNQSYAAAIQAANNTQAIKDQATAFAIVNDKRFDDLAAAGVTQTATILARLNQTEIDNLRDQLFTERRRGDNREIEINIANSNSQTQAQAQAQFQAQNDFLVRKFNEFDNQINNTKQGIINLGTMVASGTQAAAETNI